MGGGTHDTYVPPKKQLYRRGHPMKSHSAADARPNQLQQKSPTGSLPPAVPLAITPTFRPWTHTSDDSYIYRLSLLVATATVSFLKFPYYSKTTKQLRKNMPKFVFATWYIYGTGLRVILVAGLCYVPFHLYMVLFAVICMS